MGFVRCRKQKEGRKYGFHMNKVALSLTLGAQAFKCSSFTVASALGSEIPDALKKHLS